MAAAAAAPAPASAASPAPRRLTWYAAGSNGEGGLGIGSRHDVHQLTRVVAPRGATALASGGNLTAMWWSPSNCGGGGGGGDSDSDEVVPPTPPSPPLWWCGLGTDATAMAPAPPLPRLASRPITRVICGWDGLVAVAAGGTIAWASGCTPMPLHHDEGDAAVVGAGTAVAAVLAPVATIHSSWRLVALPAAGATPLVGLALARKHAVATTSDGRVWCTGASRHGALGLGAGCVDVGDWRCVIRLGSAPVDVAAGLHHSAATDGTNLLIWGSNRWLQ